jgi:hypothetical protein
MLLAMLLCAGGQAMAQSAAAKVSSAPPPMPANLEKIEEVPDSGITIKPEKKNKVTDKTKKGQNNEVEVQAGKSNYVVKSDPAVGNTSKGTPNGDANRGAMWKVLEFGGPKEAKEAEPVATLPPAPPPPTPGSAASAASAASATSRGK